MPRSADRNPQLQRALTKKLRAMAAADGAPWDNEYELERAAAEAATDYDGLAEQRRPWVVVEQANGPPTVDGYAVVRLHDLLHPPVRRGVAEERGIFWRPKHDKDKADHVAAAINALEKEGERE